MADATLKIDEAQWQLFRRGLAMGMANAAGGIDGEAKANTPVHGDPGQGGAFKTFAPGEKPIGGTLRRSIHHVVYVDGRRQFGGDTTDDNGKSVPTYSTSRGIEAFVGTNVAYAAFVHDGTVKMRARPYLKWAFSRTRGSIEGWFRAGFQRVYPQGP